MMSSPNHYGWETSVIVTNYLLKDEFKDLLQRDEAALEGQMKQFLAYLAREKSLKPWLGEQFVCDFRLGVRRDMAKLRSDREKDLLEATSIIVAVEGWCLLRFIFLKVRGGLS